MVNTSACTSNSFKILAASFITGRSESDPIMIPTRGATAFWMKTKIKVVTTPEYPSRVQYLHTENFNMFMKHFDN